MRLAPFALASVLLLAGCAAPPQRSGPVLEPDATLQGDIADGVYHDRRHWVAVAMPFPPADARYNYIKLTEEYPHYQALVSFTPLTNPGEYYRLYLEDFKAGGHIVLPLDDMADNAMRIFGKQLTRTRIEPIQLVAEKPWHNDSTKGLLRLYTEKVPTQLLMTNLGMAEDYTAYILLYVTVQSDKVAVLWMEWPQDCSVCAPVDPGKPAAGDDPLTQALAQDARAQAFLDSFHYTLDAATP